MKELKAKPKVTQAMTRDGLILENKATGEVENISSREAEQDYTPEAGGTAEKLLERPTMPMTGTRPKSPQSRQRPPLPRGTPPCTGHPHGSN